MTPFITCLCPTFRRPSRLVENAVACFLNQTYPSERCRLIVLDDSGEISEDSRGENWMVVSVDKRYDSLPEKYHALVEMAAESDIYCVWEDDECFFPRHLEGHAIAMESNQWSHPLYTYSLTTGHPVAEKTTGRFHSALAFTRKAYEETGGWPKTKRPDFDLQFLSNLRTKFGPPGNPCDFVGITYSFRWGTTKSYHGQNFMSGQNEDWWSRAGESIPPQGKGRLLVPKLDDESRGLYSRFEKEKSNV